jgi:AhpC/TSA family
MKPLRSWLPVVLAIASLGLGLLPYAALSAAGKLPLAIRDRPWLLESGTTLFAIGAVFVAVRAYRERRVRTVATIAATLAGLQALFFLFFVHIGTYALPEASRAPGVGISAPAFTLPDETGAQVSLASMRGHLALLVFYRGSW